MTSFRWRALIVGLVVFVFLVPAALFFFAVGFSSFKNVGGGPFREDACVVLHRENYAKVCSTCMDWITVGSIIYCARWEADVCCTVRLKLHANQSNVEATVTLAKDVRIEGETCDDVSMRYSFRVNDTLTCWVTGVGKSLPSITLLPPLVSPAEWIMAVFGFAGVALLAFWLLMEAILRWVPPCRRLGYHEF